MHKPLAFLTFGALLALLPGCFLFEPELPDLSGDCGAGSFPDSETAAKRNAALGEGLGTEFRPYQPGDKATLVTGGQLATMITPVLSVDAAPGDPMALCTFVELMTGGSSISRATTIQQIVTLSLINGRLLSTDTFQDQLDSSYSGDDLTLTVQVHAAEFTATQTITVQGTFGR